MYLIKRAVTHDVAKEAAEHEEHLTYVLHQLQNKPWLRFMLHVCFSALPMGFILRYSTVQAAGGPVLFR
jgi:hypothetical protein